MLTIRIDESEEKINLEDEYKLIKNTTTTKNRRGEEKKYISYSCSFPYTFIELYNNPKGVYFYEHLGKYYIGISKPPSYYYYKYVSLKTRKNSNQQSSVENRGKHWAKLITVPKTVMGELNNDMWLKYIFHCNDTDFVSGKLGLLEVVLLEKED